MLRIYLRLILLALLATEVTGGIVLFDSTAGGAGCADCSDITMYVNFEETPSGGVYTLGSTECTDGDTTGTLQSNAAVNSDAASLGSQGLDSPTKEDLMIFGSSTSLISMTSSLSFHFKVNTSARNALFKYSDGSNYIIVEFNRTAGDFSFRWKESSTSEVLWYMECTSSFSTGTWYQMEVWWDQTSVGVTSSMSVALASDGSAVCSGTDSSSLDSFAISDSSDHFRIGQHDDLNMDVHIDNFIVSTDETRDHHAAEIRTVTDVATLTNACNG